MANDKTMTVWLTRDGKGHHVDLFTIKPVWRKRQKVYYCEDSSNMECLFVFDDFIPNRRCCVEATISVKDES